MSSDEEDEDNQDLRRATASPSNSSKGEVRFRIVPDSNEREQRRKHAELIKNLIMKINEEYKKQHESGTEGARASSPMSEMAVSRSSTPTPARMGLDKDVEMVAV
jgi:hypothetical protein